MTPWRLARKLRDAVLDYQGFFAVFKQNHLLSIFVWFLMPSVSGVDYRLSRSPRHTSSGLAAGKAFTLLEEFDMCKLEWEP